MNKSTMVEPSRIPLSAALQAAAAEMNRAEFPAWLERHTLARCSAISAQTAANGTATRRSTAWWWPGSLAALAFVMLVSVLLLLAAPPLPKHDSGPESAGLPSDFLPLVSPQALADAAARPGPAWLVSTEMPRERLAALGLPFDPGRAGEPVHAELLMNPNGQVLAVRLLPE